VGPGTAALVAAAILLLGLPSAGTGSEIHSLFEQVTERRTLTPIDSLVFGRLQELGIQPAHACSDAVFLRRAYLDAIGTLPTPEEARRFLTDPSPGKRPALVGVLLARDEFADYWAMKWSDLLRVKSEFPINLWPNAVQAYHRWIRTCIREGVPYDRFARELLTASGSNLRVPQTNFYRAIQSRQPEAIASAVALTFLGVRTDRWPEGRLQNMARFFREVRFKGTREWKEEIVYHRPGGREGPGASGWAVFPDGASVEIVPGQDPREAFVRWLVQPGNPWFARCIVNRVWFWLLGRGIVHEPDDLRPDNPAQNPELLSWLEKELVASHYDLRHIYRLILNSATYQLSALPRTDHPQARANFACYPLRRLDAEVLIDALCQITGTTERYHSPIPEPFTYIPEGHRSIALADGSTTSAFLEMFGRPPRDTGLESERSRRFTTAQRLHLLNSSHIRRKIERGPGLRRLLRSARKPRRAVDQVFLAVLSRLPTAEERDTVLAFVREGVAGRREKMVDLVWTLVNSAEFLYQH